jgi:hypothetical protein
MNRAKFQCIPAQEYTLPRDLAPVRSSFLSFFLCPRAAPRRCAPARGRLLPLARAVCAPAPCTTSAPPRAPAGGRASLCRAADKDCARAPLGKLGGGGATPLTLHAVCMCVRRQHPACPASPCRPWAWRPRSYEVSCALAAPMRCPTHFAASPFGPARQPTFGHIQRLTPAQTTRVSAPHRPALAAARWQRRAAAWRGARRARAVPPPPG